MYGEKNWPFASSFQQGRLRLLVVFFLLTLGSSFTAAQTKLPAETPPYLGGFDRRRIPIELQAWWTPNYGHIHAAANLPLGQKVSGTLNFDVRIVLHDNPSHLVELRFDTEGGVFLRMPLNLSCPYDGTASTNCAFNVPVSLDTTKMPDGWREIRIRATTDTPDGKRYLNSSGVPLYVDNGSGSDSNYNRFCNNTSLIGRGWYEGFGYANAIIECVPLEPVHGQVTFRVRAQQSSRHLRVSLDATHPIPSVGPWPAIQGRTGVVLFDQDGDFQNWVPIAIDTTQLEDGWHSLGVRSEGPNGEASTCSYCKGETNHNAGTAKMWFYVQNGSAPPADNTPPILSDVNPTQISGSSANTVWNTNEPADSKVEYGVTSALGSVAVAGGLVSTHSVTLSGLSSGTLYYYRAVSNDAAGNNAVSATATFTTLLPTGDTTLPTVSFGASPSSQLTRTLTLNLLARDNVGVVRVEIWIDDQKIGDFTPSAVQSLTLDVTAFGAGTHTVAAKAFDAAGNVATLSQLMSFDPLGGH